MLLYISFFPSNILLPSQVLVEQFDNVRRNIRALVLLAFILEGTSRYLSRSNQCLLPINESPRWFI